MNSSERIRLAIEKLVIDHPTYVEAKDRIAESVDDALAGFLDQILFLTGPSQTGKSAILKAIRDEYPQNRPSGRLIAQVLYVRVSPGVSPKGLPLCVLKALGQPVKGVSRVGDLSERMKDSIRRAGVRVILFDEANHLIDKGHRISARLVGDWFKDLVDEMHVTCVLAGIPKLSTLLEANEQLRNRAQRPIELWPYRWDRKHDRFSFAGCARKFLDCFAAEGYHAEMGWDAMTRHLYLLSAGQIGLLAKFCRELAKRLDELVISLSQLREAAARVNLPGGRDVSAFGDVPPSDALLMRVLVSELAISGLVLPSDTADAELANRTAHALKAEFHGAH